MKWKQERIVETDIRKLVAGTGLSMRKIAQGCGLHYTYISKCMSDKAVMSEQAFAKFTRFLEDNQIT